MHIVVHLIVFAAAGAVFFLLTRPAELSGDRRWKTQLSHGLLLCAMLGLGAHAIDASGLEMFAVAGALASLLVLGFLWAPNFCFLASRSMTSLLYGDGYAGGGFRPDFRGARARIKDQDWAEAVRAIEPELAKDPNDFEGLRLLAEACVPLNQVGRAQAQLEIILRNPDATTDQKRWAKSERARIGDGNCTAPPRVPRLSRSGS